MTRKSSETEIPLSAAEIKAQRDNMNVDAIPQSLKDIPHWVCWIGKHKGGNPKFTKIPINPKTRKNASTNMPSTWGAFDQALSSFRKHTNLCGIGFVFGPDDPFVGVDLDNCRDPDTGELSPVAREILDTLKTYTEVSPSGKGVKAFLSGCLLVSPLFLP